MGFGWFKGTAIGRWFGHFGDEVLMRIVLSILILAMVGMYFSSNIIVSIQAGHVGVLWSRFGGGTVTDHVYGEGIHLIFPWDKMIPYDVRARHVTRTYDAITSDGLAIKVTLDVRYHVAADQAGTLHKYVGEDYINVVIGPRVGAFARAQLSRFNAEEIYSKNRLYIEHAILDQLRTNRLMVSVGGGPQIHFIVYDDILMHAVELPEPVRLAIESKVAQFEAQREWEYRVARERLESERRIVEAQATRTVLDTLGNKLTDRYLQMRSIDAMLQLAMSPNTKIVVTSPGTPVMPFLAGSDAAGQAATNAGAPKPLFSGGSTLPTMLPQSNLQPRQSVPANPIAPGDPQTPTNWWHWLPFSAPNNPSPAH